jgi:Holliday junction resolvase
VRDVLRAEGWVVIRAAGSLGVCDLVALAQSQRTMFVEVKATAGGPYERFSPGARSNLSAVAEEAGADAWLAWWPPRKELAWIPERDWPRP